jgi:hypothetical protein
MKKKILMLTLAALLAVSPVCFAAPGDDKVAHFGTGYIINDQLQRNTKATFAERLLIITTIGTLKEATDSRFDWRDLGATVAGGLAREIKLEWKF